MANLINFKNQQDWLFLVSNTFWRSLSVGVVSINTPSPKIIAFV